LSHCRLVPLRYWLPARFDTIPSRPSVHALANTSAPSADRAQDACDWGLDLSVDRKEHIRIPKRLPTWSVRRRNIMGRLLAFLAALFAMGLTAHAQDDPGALAGVYGPSQAFPTLTRAKGRPASPAPGLEGVHAPGEIAPGPSAPRRHGPHGSRAWSGWGLCSGAGSARLTHSCGCSEWGHSRDGSEFHNVVRARFRADLRAHPWQSDVPLPRQSRRAPFRRSSPSLEHSADPAPRPTQ
jgi:hypothetical protein